MTADARLQLLHTAGRWTELELLARRLLAVDSAVPGPWQALGAACVQLGRYQEAGEAFKRVLALTPHDVETMRELARLCGLAGDPETAMACLQQALRIQPDYAPIWLTLADVLKNHGDIPGALACFRKAIALQTASANAGCFEAYTALLFTLYNVDPTRLRPDAEAFGRALSTGVTPFFQWKYAPPRPLCRSLNVALVSADFRNHAVALFLCTVLPELAAHGLTLYAFSNWPEQDEDQLTARLRPHFTHWHNIYGLTNAEAAKRIHDAGVHVCLDLSGHTSGNRLGVFAWRPAPVQAVWCGYATTGLSAFDAFIADADTLPPTAEAHFSEPIHRLPVRLCFSPPDYAGLGVSDPVSSLPALKNGYITFGCFQHLDKIRPHTLILWAELLRRLPTARLRVQCNGLHLASVRDAFCIALRQHGINLERVHLQGSMPREAYLHAYDEVDIALDTAPYNGCTTTCEALWMGVPTLSLVGDTLISRQGYGVLRAAGLSDWALETPENLLCKAQNIATDLPALDALRAGLRAQVVASPLMDAVSYAEAFSSLLHNLWHTKMNPKPAQPFTILKENDLMITSCVQRVKQIMDCVIAAKTGPAIENADLCEAVLSWLEDDDSRRLYARELTFKMLEPLIGTSGAIQYAGVMSLETWQQAEDTARRLLAEGGIPHVETDFPPDHPMSIFIPTCNFVLEQYAHPPHVTVRPTDVVLDGGACYGETAIWFARQGARVYAFEPNPSSVALLRKNVERAGLGAQIVSIPSALGRTNGQLAFQHMAENPTGSSFAQKTDANTFAVAVCTVDDWCQKQLVTPTWIKLDVEGAEMDALCGAAKTIAAHGPTITVALYHTLAHMWEIPAYLRQLRPDYQFWCRKNHPQSEFVLYAKLPQA